MIPNPKVGPNPTPKVGPEPKKMAPKPFAPEPKK
jgi:hypothetical protein